MMPMWQRPRCPHRSVTSCILMQAREIFALFFGHSACRPHLCGSHGRGCDTCEVGSAKSLRIRVFVRTHKLVSGQSKRLWVQSVSEQTRPVASASEAVSRRIDLSAVQLGDRTRFRLFWLLLCQVLNEMFPIEARTHEEPHRRMESLQKRRAGGDVPTSMGAEAGGW